MKQQVYLDAASSPRSSVHLLAVLFMKLPGQPSLSSFRAQTYKPHWPFLAYLIYYHKLCALMEDMLLRRTGTSTVWGLVVWFLFPSFGYTNLKWVCMQKGLSVAHRYTSSSKTGSHFAVTLQGAARLQKLSKQWVTRLANLKFILGLSVLNQCYEWSIAYSVCLYSTEHRGIPITSYQCRNNYAFTFPKRSVLKQWQWC